jgi:hypothetical protein
MSHREYQWNVTEYVIVLGWTTELVKINAIILSHGIQTNARNIALIDGLHQQEHSRNRLSTVVPMASDDI